MRSFAIALALTLGKCFSGSATYLIRLMNSLDLHPMALLWVCALLSFAGSFYLPETRGKQMKN